MKLVKRLKNADIYKVGYNPETKMHSYRAVLGVCNVEDDNGNFVPLDNELNIITSHPIVKYVLKQGPFFIGFHNKSSNKYLSVIKLKSGESLVKTAIGDPQCTPTVKNKHTLQWKYGNGSWIREYVTEKHLKEVMFQKAGQQIQFKYKLTGLTVRKDGNKFDILRGDKIVFSIDRPYYMTQEGDFISWVPITWKKQNDDWIVTYPSPDQDCYIS